MFCSQLAFCGLAVERTVGACEEHEQRISVVVLCIGINTPTVVKSPATACVEIILNCVSADVAAEHCCSWKYSSPRDHKGF